MTSRSLYRYLLRLHPSRFRKRYEDQMLWIFDETVQSRGSSSLLLDAAVSLARQWVLRSGHWRKAQPAVTGDGTIALAELLHRNSQRLYRRAWRFNVLWVAAAVIVLATCPIPIFLKCVVAIIAVDVTSLFSGNQLDRQRPESPQYISLFYYKTSRNFYRNQIEAKRDVLRAWAAAKDKIGVARAIIVSLTIFTLVIVIRPMIKSYLGVPNVGFDWNHSKYFFYGMTAVLLSWRLIRSVNERAAEAIQQEIDAMDDPSIPTV